MSAANQVYDIFNQIEGVVWIAVAVGIFYVVKPTSTNQYLARATASIGFILFGVTDFIEASYHGNLPSWLWTAKILCACHILACRFWYIGWHRFTLKDRYVRFGIFCMIATVGVISYQTYLYGR